MIKILMERLKSFSRDADSWFDKLIPFFEKSRDRDKVGDFESLVSEKLKKSEGTDLSDKDMKEIYSAVPEYRLFSDMKVFLNGVINGKYDDEFQSRPEMFKEFVAYLSNIFTYKETEEENDFVV
jgi:hypothetical protein